MPERRSKVNRRSSRPRRRNRRLGISKRVDYNVKSKKTFGYTKDLSARGMFVRTSKLLAEGSTVKFLIKLEQGYDPVTIKGKVVRTEKGSIDAGMAVTFPDEPMEARAAIAAFVLDRLEERELERLESNPDGVKILEELGDICLERGDPEGATEYYQHALEIDPSSVWARIRLAYLTFAQADESGDEQIYRDTLRHLEIAGVGDADLRNLQSQCERALAAFEARRADAVKQRDDELAAEQRMLDDQRAELELRRAEQETEASQLSLREQELGDREQTLDAQSNATVAREAALEAQRLRLAERLRRSRAILESRRREAETARESIDATVAERVASREQQIETAAEEAAAAEADALHRREELASERERLEERHRVLEAGRDELVAAQAELAGERDKLAKGRRTLESSRDELVEAQVELTRERDRVAEDRNQVETALEEITRSRDQLNEERREAHALRSDLEQERADLEASVVELGETREALEAAEQDYLHQKEALEAARTETLRDRVELSDERDAATNEAERKQAEIAEERAAVRQERETLQASRMQLGTEREKLAAQDDELTTIRAKLESTQAEIDADRAEVAAKEDSLDDERARLLAAQEALQGSQQELADALQQMSEVQEAYRQERGRLGDAEAEAREVEAAGVEQQETEARDAALRAVETGLQREQETSAGLERSLRRAKHQASEAAVALRRASEESCRASAERLEAVARAATLERDLASMRGERDRLAAKLTGTGADQSTRDGAAADEGRPASSTPSEEASSEADQTPWTSRDINESLPGPFADSPYVPAEIDQADGVVDDDAFHQAPTGIMRRSLRLRLHIFWLGRVSPSLTALRYGAVRRRRAAGVWWRQTGPKIRGVVIGSAGLVLFIAAFVVAGTLSFRAEEPEEPVTPPEEQTIAQPTKPPLIELTAEEEAFLKPPPPKHSRLSLSREEIVLAVNTAPKKKLRGCWTSARRRGEMRAGQYTFELGWVVREDGSVVDAELLRPTLLIDTKFSRCVSAALEGWRFPASKRESIVRNYPYGPLRVR
ncbi:MAG: PilZ domain-containing protein [Myxococcota bacterium]